MPDTIAYYNDNAEAFFSDTAGVDMADLHRRFLQAIPEGGRILDAGCGSGRDSKAFLGLQYRVRAFDASPELARKASDHIGQAVAVQTFEDVSEVACYDGVWACASLLHLTESALPKALGHLWTALKPAGTLYVSFKLGEAERVHNGRHFTDAKLSRASTVGSPNWQTWTPLNTGPRQTNDPGGKSTG